MNPKIEQSIEVSFQQLSHMTSYTNRPFANGTKARYTLEDSIKEKAAADYTAIQDWWPPVHPGRKQSASLLQTIILIHG